MTATRVRALLVDTTPVDSIARLVPSSTPGTRSCGCGTDPGWAASARRSGSSSRAPTACATPPPRGARWPRPRP
ncbi:hypothetical protein [Clavibacter tessellarius]|uniref:hypothetical protein n=1 Tax=Clavibacter tessellarius TaxID=31965 RepID=UPI0032503ECD